MSIDTAYERRMAACIKPIHKAPIPDGLIDAYDRGHISWIWGARMIIPAEVALHAQKRPFALHATEREFALHAQRRPFSLHARGKT